MNDHRHDDQRVGIVRPCRPGGGGRELQAVPVVVASADVLRTKGNNVNNTVKASVMVASVVSALTVVVNSPVAARQLDESPLSCGTTITTDTRLVSDLINCPNNGLVIGADNITLDLNGHTIDGDDTVFTECAADEPCDLGISAFDHSGITVKDGSVKEFGFGVIIGGATETRLTRLSLSESLFSGLVVFNSSGIKVDRATVTANGLTTDQAGIDVFDSHDLELKRSVVTDNGDIGLFIVGLDNSRVLNTTFAGNPESGILMEGSGNVIAENRFSDGPFGLAFSGDGNTVARNQLAGAPCSDDCGVGIQIEGGRNNVIEDNVVERFHQAGIHVASFEAEGGPPGPTQTTVRKNVVRDSDLDGLLIDSTVVDTVLERNTANRRGRRRHRRPEPRDHPDPEYSIAQR